MRIVAYRTQMNNGKLLLSESTGESKHSNDLMELFSFLLEPYENSIRICWELDATVAPLLRLLGERRCLKLKENHKCYCPPFNIFYIPSKVFSISHIPSHEKANLYDLAQYYPELNEPDNLIEVQMLGEKLIQELKKMGLEPTKLTSPIAIYEECVMQHLDLPTVADMPKEVAEFAYRCSGKLWIEAYQLKYLKQAYDYDLTSSFPLVARDLIDIRQCKWMKSSEYQPDAIYGYAKCEVTIYDWVMVSPILRHDRDGSLESFTGTCELYLTKSELDFIDKWQIGEYKILEGWWGMPTISRVVEPSKPLAKPIDKLLAYKQKTGLQSALAKRMAVGFYGKFGEERLDSFGPYFNPCWFAEISTQVRLQVAEKLYSHGIGPRDNEGYKHLLHVSVDGFLLDSLLEETSNGWRLSYVGRALVISSGLVYTEMTRPKGLTLEMILQAIREHPQMSYYEWRLPRRVTLNDALAMGKFEDTGKTARMVTSIDLVRLEHDRKFTSKPRTGKQILKGHYGSKPKRIPC